ncbi:S-layer homology domain-containing protein [Paenibacillus sp. GCM10027627]|uniref:S-layer homology domain-containing protein n=1 Tax=unclassified Paenibacillus TaxID=185978 RepID=UPI00363015D9
MFFGKRVGMACCCILLFLLAGVPVQAQEKAASTKTFDLKEPAAQIVFSLESRQASLESKLILPSGHVILGNMTRVVRQESDGGKVWSSTYSVSPAPKGKYRFEITAAKAGYFNLQVEISLFSDMNGHWAKEWIEDYAKRGIVSGYGNGTFRPDDFVSFEALVKMSVFALTEEQPNGKRQWLRALKWKVLDEQLAMKLGWENYSFYTTDPMEWFAPFLQAAVHLGMDETGIEAARRDSVLRKDAAVFFSDLVKLVDAQKPNHLEFIDTRELGEKYRNSIDIVANKSVFSGYADGTFKPEKEVTRAEAVKAVSQLEQYMKSL